MAAVHTRYGSNNPAGCEMSFVGEVADVVVIFLRVIISIFYMLIPYFLPVSIVI